VNSKSTRLGGNHTAEEGAKRYINALLKSDNDSDNDNGNGNGNDNGNSNSNSNNNADDEPMSGSFLASRKGFIKDYGNVAYHKKGGFITDTELQDKAWNAVNQFLL